LDFTTFTRSLEDRFPEDMLSGSAAPISFGRLLRRLINWFQVRYDPEWWVRGKKEEDRFQ
jgi:hypothetical protein